VLLATVRSRPKVADGGAQMIACYRTLAIPVRAPAAEPPGVIVTWPTLDHSKFFICFT
jgi:hypothetical protein